MNMKTRVLEEIEERDVISVLQRLVQIRSRNPPGEEKPLAEHIVQTMREWGFEAHLVPIPDPKRPQAVAIIKGKNGRPKLVLNGHMDTVPEGDRSGWSVDPFSGEVKDGRLYGRGSSDMKGGIAAMMIAAKTIKDIGIKLKGDLILQFAMGEEAGEPGTRSLLLDEGFVGDWGIVLEPTNLRIATVEKGVAFFNVTIRGRLAHGSTPDLGVNAIEKAIDFLTSLRKYRKQIMKRKHPLVGRALCTVTMMSAGIKNNVLPDTCRLTLDRRLLPNETVDIVEGELREILSKIEEQDPEFKWKLERGTVFDISEIPGNHPLVRIVKKNVKKVTGEAPKPYGTLFSTDVRNFINDAGIPAIAWGPGDPAESTPSTSLQR